MICPKCGSELFAKIQYGLPPFDDDFRLPASYQERIDKKDIILGGCCIFPDSPKYMCLDCHFKYGSAPYYIKDDENHFHNENYLDIKSSLSCFRFICGGYFGGVTKLIIEKQNHQAVMAVIPSRSKAKSELPLRGISDDEWINFIISFDLNESHFNRQKEENRSQYLLNEESCSLLFKHGLAKYMTDHEWNVLLDMLFSELLLHEWDNEYVDSTILDGTQWSIKYECRDSSYSRRIGGSNKYPPYWKRFRAYITELTAWSDLKQ